MHIVWKCHISHKILYYRMSINNRRKYLTHVAFPSAIISFTRVVERCD